MLLIERLKLAAQLRQQSGLRDSVIPAILDQSTVVRIDNVAHYIWQDDSPVDSWSFKNYPNVAPAWPMAWFEFTDRDFPDREHSYVVQCGVLSMAVDLKDDDAESYVRSQPGFSKLVEHFPQCMTIARWLVHLRLWVEREGEGPVFSPSLFSATYPVDEHGVVCEVDGPDSVFKKIVLFGTPEGKQEDEQDDLRIAKGVYAALAPVHLALSFAHCKNVALVNNEPPPKLSRAQLKRRGVAKVAYKTLAIEPMKEVLRREGGSQSVGLQKSLHICRGHFANYDENPLFGKHRGRFWVPQHVKGRASQGVVVKKYDVKAPKGGK